jgi:hypothetical protein
MQQKCFGKLSMTLNEKAAASATNEQKQPPKLGNEPISRVLSRPSRFPVAAAPPFI